jgi:hypothetical protein
LKYKEAYKSIISLDDLEKHPILEDYDESNAEYMTTTFTYPLNKESAQMID